MARDRPCRRPRGAAFRMAASGRIDLGRGHDPGPCRPPDRDRHQLAPGRRRPGYRRGALDACRPRLCRIPRRRRGRLDVCRRAISRELCRASRQPRDDGAARPRTAQRDAISRRQARRGRPGRDRARRPAGGSQRRRGPGRWSGRGGARRSRPGRADRGIHAGAAEGRRHRHERIDQCRRGLSPDGVAARGREHLCRHRPPGGRRPAFAGADVAAGRPLRHGVPGGDHRARRSGLALERRSDPRRGRAGGGDAVSAHPRGAGRDRVRPVARGQAGHPDQGRPGARDLGAGARARHRQDRDLDARPGPHRRDQSRRGCAGRRASAARGLARPGFQAHHRADHRR